MDDAAIVRQLARGNTAALELAMQRYGAYVSTVVRNRSRGFLSQEDCEEIVSDVFVILWQRAAEIVKEQLRPWLGAVARNRTADAMRKQNVFLPLEEETSLVLDGLWQSLYEKQRRAAVRRAFSRLSEEDREIFFRFYDLCQTAAQIAEEMGHNPSTVRTRLRRGRETLRRELCKGGMFCEDSN